MSELRKVIWPARRSVARNTVTVAVVFVCVVVVFAAVELGVARAVLSILN